MKKCFVISPIGLPDSAVREQADAVLEYIIEPALRDLDVEAVRADRLAEPGLITDQMIAAILNYDLCIADLSGHNPNVFYEVALAQAAERPIVLLKLAGESIPFDLKDYRLIEYDLKPRSLMTGKWIPLLKDQLRRLMETDYKAPRLMRGRLISKSDGFGSFMINARSEEFGDAPRYHEVVQRASQHCWLMGVSLKVWSSDEGQRVLRDLASRHVPVKILIMDPDNPAFAPMINTNLPSEDLESVVRQSKRMADYFRSIKTQSPESFEVRTIRTGLPHFQLIVTEQTALVLQYMFSRSTADSPLQQFPASSQLHRAYAEEFQNLWRLNE